MLPVRLLSSRAKLPTRGTKGSAGLDLYADIDPNELSNGVNIYPQETKAVSTGLSVEIPIGFLGYIVSRSGLAIRYSIGILCGVIDSDYRGELSVIVHNHGKNVVHFNHGDKIAQLVILPYIHLVPFKLDSLTDTERGDKGFGSTGND